MKIWSDMNIRGNKSAVASTNYRQVQLVDASQQPIDLFIYNARLGRARLFSCLSSSKPDAWLEEGRPQELGSLPLATWALLTTSVTEYQRGLGEVRLRIARRIIVPAYAAWIVAVLLSSWAYEQGNDREGNCISSLAAAGFFLAMFAYVFVAQYYTQKHAQEVFHPSIQTVLQELDRPLTEAGFEVDLIVEEAFAGSKPILSFLRFAPLRDDDQDAKVIAEAENNV